MKVKALLKAVTKTEKARSGRMIEAEMGRPLSKAVHYTLHHLGSMPVEEEEHAHGKRYRDGLGASAVRTIVVMAKSAHNKGVEVQLDVSASKIRVQERSSQKVLVDAPIQRICFCTCDGVYNKVFAFIYRVPEKEVMECHAFYCGTPQVARTLALAMNGAFIAALEGEQRFQQQLRDAHAFPVSIPIYPTRHFNTTGASTASSSACSSAGSISRSAGSGSSSMRSGNASPIETEADSASLNSTRSANYSADSANGEMSTTALVDMVAKQFARDLLASRSETRSDTASRSSQRAQVVHAAQVHAPPTTAAEQKLTVPTSTCRKSWQSTDDIQDSCEPLDNAPLRCPANFSCVLPVSAAAATS